MHVGLIFSINQDDKQKGQEEIPHKRCKVSQLDLDDGQA